MDWSKAKNILIIAFIITNIFLAYSLSVIESNKSEIEIEDKFLVDVTNLLAQKDIYIKTDIPKHIPSLPTISIEYEKYSPRQMADIFLGEYTRQIENGVIYYKNDKETLKLENSNKTIIYTNEYLKQNNNKQIISKQEAIDISKNFIKQNKFDRDDFKLSFIKQEDNIYKIHYSKIFNDITLEETYMKLEVSKQGVISFQRHWIDRVKESNNIVKASSAPKALLRILTKQEYYGKTIEEISLCYYFNSQEYQSDINFSDAKGGKAIPAWRFKFEDGTKAFLEEN